MAKDDLINVNVTLLEHVEAALQMITVDVEHVEAATDNNCVRGARRGSAADNNCVRGGAPRGTATGDNGAKEENMTLKADGDLSEVFAAAIEHLLERGFAAPLYFYVLGANGSMLMGTLAPDEGKGHWEPIFHGQHTPGGAFRLPMNVAFFDARGEAARLVFSSAGLSWVN
jgi:hypothetical protein